MVADRLTGALVEVPVEFFVLTLADRDGLGAVLLVVAVPLDRCGAAVQPVATSSKPAQLAAITLMGLKTARVAG